MISIIPISAVTGFNALWPSLIEGFQAIMKHSEGDWSIESVYQDLLNGKMTLNLIQVDGMNVGFLTTSIQHNLNAKRCLNIYYMHLQAGTSLDVLPQVHEWAKERMKEYLCQLLFFYTTRERAFEKRLRDLKFRTGYVQFVYELEEGQDGKR